MELSVSVEVLLHCVGSTLCFLHMDLIEKWNWNKNEVAEHLLQDSTIAGVNQPDWLNMVIHIFIKMKYFSWKRTIMPRVCMTLLNNVPEEGGCWRSTITVDSCRKSGGAQIRYGWFCKLKFIILFFCMWKYLRILTPMEAWGFYWIPKCCCPFISSCPCSSLGFKVSGMTSFIWPPLNCKPPFWITDVPFLSFSYQNPCGLASFVFQLWKTEIRKETRKGLVEKCKWMSHCNGLHLDPAKCSCLQDSEIWRYFQEEVVRDWV